MLFRSEKYRKYLWVGAPLLVALLAATSPWLFAAETQGIAADSDSQEGMLGTVIEEFSLKDFRGKEHSLSDWKDKRLIVAYFMGTECPLAKLYGPRMQRFAEEFADQGVAFVGINPNVQDSIAEIAAHVRDHKIKFPILKDVGNKIADKFGATRTPQVYVLDEERAIRYYGRIDGQYTFGSGVGLAKPFAKRHDLSQAIEELLAGKEVSVPITEAKGCLIGRVRDQKADSEVTYSNQIARILQDRCIECHRKGQIAPFELTEYEEVVGWGEMIMEVVQEQRMPPWHADPAFGHFSNENRLTEGEKEMIYTWVRNGCPEGDPANLPQPREYQEGWFMPGGPEQVIYMTDEPVDVKAEGIESYRHYEVDPGFTEDKWVRMVECLPGNKKVVHHIIVYIKPPKGLKDDRDTGDISHYELLAGFAPGTRPMIAPDGWAKKIPAGAKLLFEMHYTPIGTPQVDRSSLGLVFVDEEDVTHHTWTTNVVNPRFAIPPHESDHVVEKTKTIKNDVLLVSLFPHMHMRGKSFRYELTYPDGEKEVLLNVPQYDFNWQTSFILAEPKPLPEGSKMHCTAVFDNSKDNLANPDPTKTVRWGEQTWDEMMIGWYDVAVRRE